jgi:hypothetical protein
MTYCDDAARLLYEEIDYLHEGNNAQIFRDSMVNSSKVISQPQRVLPIRVPLRPHTRPQNRKHPTPRVSTTKSYFRTS